MTDAEVLLLERDIAAHPEHLVSLDVMRDVLLALTHGAEFDLAAALDPGDE